MIEGQKPWFIHEPPPWLVDRVEYVDQNPYNTQLMNLPTPNGVVNIPTALPYITFIPSPVFAKDTHEPMRWSEVAEKLGVTGEFVPNWNRYIVPSIPGLNPNVDNIDAWPEDLLDGPPGTYVIPQPTLDYIEQHVGEAAYGLANRDLNTENLFRASDHRGIKFIAGMPADLVEPYILHYPSHVSPIEAPACVYLDRDPHNGLKLEDVIPVLEGPLDLPTARVFWNADTTWVAMMNPDESGTYVFTATEEAQRALCDPESSQEVYVLRPDQVYIV